jgi:hypothetical protein
MPFAVMAIRMSRDMLLCVTGAHLHLRIFEIAQDHVVTRGEWDGGKGRYSNPSWLSSIKAIRWGDVKESGRFLFRGDGSATKRLVVGLIAHVRRTLTE